MKISEDQVKAAYTVAKQVWRGSITSRDGAQELHTDHGLNINSARDFIEDHKALLQGRVFQRAMSAPAMEYFLSQIEKDHGQQALSTALQALRKHITYYENVSETNLHKMRGVAAKFSLKIDHPLDYDQFQERFLHSVEASQKDSSEKRQQRLKEAPLQPQRTNAMITVFVRNPDVVAEVLERACGNCERCRKAAPFLRRKDSTPYLEVHHTVRLADGGEDSVENALALCPNCHRELHFGSQGSELDVRADSSGSQSNAE